MDIAKNEKKFNIAIIKFIGNNAKFIYENLANLGNRKLYYNFNGSTEYYGLDQNVIAVTNKYMEFYSFIDIKKTIKIEKK